MTNNSIPRMNKTLQKELKKYRDKIAELPITPKRSSLVDCITFVLEGGSSSNE